MGAAEAVGAGAPGAVRPTVTKAVASSAAAVLRRDMSGTSRETNAREVRPVLPSSSVLPLFARHPVTDS
ncbi:hypothetical protein GCM10009639_63160 [Kitasatospora putterlickiae]|uniref:Uncharacterized protein n=1 Tax=Kitasatospora putterlickiae TaxID=221725 RepID=A0ABP4J6Q6_9ACTN